MILRYEFDFSSDVLYFVGYFVFILFNLEFSSVGNLFIPLIHVYQVLDVLSTSIFTPVNLDKLMLMLINFMWL